jgi:hypothetical protein
LLLGAFADSRCWRHTFSPTASCQGTGCAISSRVILVLDAFVFEGFWLLFGEHEFLRLQRLHL